MTPAVTAFVRVGTWTIIGALAALGLITAGAAIIVPVAVAAATVGVVGWSLAGQRSAWVALGFGAAGGVGVLAIAGLALLVGPATFIAAPALVAPLVWTRRTRKPTEQAAAVEEDRSALRHLSNAQLAREWHASYTALAMVRDPRSLELICGLRRRQLDEDRATRPRRVPALGSKAAPGCAATRPRSWAVEQARRRPQRQPTVNAVGALAKSPYRCSVLRVRLLGDIAAERDGEPVPLSGPHRRLLAFLALHPGPHERDALAARLWPDLPTARANLRTAVWGLRRVLGADAVEATRTSVALTRVVTDVDEVGPTITRGDLSPLDATPCVGLDDDWVAVARAEHVRRCVAALDVLATTAAVPADAARWTARRCALTPLDEPAHRMLIERLAAAGDRAGALVAGRDLAERLRAESGRGPAPATRAAIARLRGPVGGPRPPSGLGPPMFGRAAELATLGRAWSAARTGRGQVVFVTGEAGIGKTRLVSELARRADNAGARVAVGAGFDVGGEAPLQLWEESARALATVVPRPPDSLGWPAELGRLAPDLARALGRHGAPPLVAAPELERLRVFDAVLRLVEWAAAGRPVLLVAEDVHRADRASLALSAHIGRRLAALPVLFVLTRRDRPAHADADALLADLGSRGVEVTEIDLGPLPGGAVAEVATVAALPAAAVDRVVAVADGNPLLAVESARAAAAGGLEGATPPSSLRAMVRAALGGLPEYARALAEAIAASGRGLSAAEVAALLGSDGDAERRVLDSGLLHRSGGRLRYRHALLAETARADLRDPEGTHLAVALAVEAAAAPVAARAAEVAHHLRQAGRDDLAAPRWRQAARHARALGALPEATAFWAAAVRCDPDDGATRLELAEVHAWSGRTVEFEHEWAAALAALTPAEAADAWRRRGLLLKTVVLQPRSIPRGLPPGRGAAHTGRARRTPGPGARRPRLERRRDGGRDARGGAARAGAGAGGGDGHAAETVGAVAADEVVAETESARLITLIRLGRFAECEAVAGVAGAAADRLRRPDLAYVIWIQTTCALTCAGDLEGALRTADRGIAATRDVPVVAPSCLAARAHLLARHGRHMEAAEVVTELRPPRAGSTRRRCSPWPGTTRAWSRWPRAATARRRTCCARRSTATPRSAARPPGWRRPRRWRAQGTRTRPPSRSAAPHWSPSGPRTSHGRSCRGWRASRAWWPGPAATRRRRGDGSRGGGGVATASELGGAAGRGVPCGAGRPRSPADRRVGRTRPGAGQGQWRVGGAGGRMSGYTLTGTAKALVEDVWKLLFDPVRFPEWWVGVESVRVDTDRDYTVWPDGLPDYPMPQIMRTDRANGRVLMSRQVSDIDFVWQLAEDGNGTGITLRVTIPAPKAPVLAEKRPLLAASVVALAELAEREHRPGGRPRHAQAPGAQGRFALLPHPHRVDLRRAGWRPLAPGKRPEIAGETLAAIRKAWPLPPDEHAAGAGQRGRHGGRRGDARARPGAAAGGARARRLAGPDHRGRPLLLDGRRPGGPRPDKIHFLKNAACSAGCCWSRSTWPWAASPTRARGHPRCR